LLSGTFARGGDPAFKLTGQRHLDIVYFPNAPGPGECSVAKPFELIALSAPMPGLRHDGIATAQLTIRREHATPIPSVSGVLIHTEYLPCLSIENLLDGIQYSGGPDDQHPEPDGRQGCHSAL